MPTTRFQIVYSQDNPVDTISILLDSETGIQYLIISNEYGVSLCRL